MFKFFRRECSCPLDTFLVFNYFTVRAARAKRARLEVEEESEEDDSEAGEGDKLKTINVSESETESKHQNTKIAKDEEEDSDYDFERDFVTDPDYMRDINRGKGKDLCMICLQSSAGLDASVGCTSHW